MLNSLKIYEDCRNVEFSIQNLSYVSPFTFLSADSSNSSSTKNRKKPANRINKLLVCSEHPTLFSCAKYFPNEKHVERFP